MIMDKIVLWKYFLLPIFDFPVRMIEAFRKCQRGESELKSDINRLIPSAERATLLSFSSMVFSFFMVLLFPAFGWIGDHLGLQYSFLFAACTAVALVIINLYILLSNKGERAGDREKKDDGSCGDEGAESL